MNYIKKAVELADGWEWHSKGNGFAYYFDHATDEKDMRYNFISFYVGDDELKGELQFGLDALAAQLLRQVQQIAKERKQPWLWANIITAIRKQGLDADITDFTIKNIIDSGVLDG